MPSPRPEFDARPSIFDVISKRDMTISKRAYSAPRIHDELYVARYGTPSLIPLSPQLAILLIADFTSIFRDSDVIVCIGYGNNSCKLAQPMSDCWSEIVMIGTKSSRNPRKGAQTVESHQKPPLNIDCLVRAQSRAKNLAQNPVFLMEYQSRILQYFSTLSIF